MCMFSILFSLPARPASHTPISPETARMFPSDESWTDYVIRWEDLISDKLTVRLEHIEALVLMQLVKLKD